MARIDERNGGEPELRTAAPDAVKTPGCGCYPEALPRREARRARADEASDRGAATPAATVARQLRPAAAGLAALPARGLRCATRARAGGVRVVPLALKDLFAVRAGCG